MVRHSISLPFSRWTGKLIYKALPYVLLVVNACASSYLRETTSLERELQSLPTLDDIITTDSNLTALSAAFKAAKLVGQLCTTDCNFTTFAPTNEAFDSVDQAFLTTLLTPSWILHLKILLTFHITLPSIKRLLSTDFVDGQIFEMINSEEVTVNDLKRGISLTSSLTTGSTIVEPDILASNGALHKVDTVLSPGFFRVDVFALGDQYEKFTIFQDLLEIIGLAGTEGEYTLLAPRNEAFLELGNETLTALKEDKVALGKILANHVIVGVFPSMYLKDGLVLESMGGFNITVTKKETMGAIAGSVMFNDATGIQSDILARNGIAHAVDTVIREPNPMSNVPFDVPSSAPIGKPLSKIPLSIPSDSPLSIPSDSPLSIPSDSPLSMPSDFPSSIPSDAPSSIPSDTPSSIPSDTPSSIPSDSPSTIPSDVPTLSLISVFDIGEVNQDFTILGELLDLAGLSDLVGEFTLLAPDNDAWLALGEDTLTNLRGNMMVLEELLRNHIINGIVPPNALVDGAVFPTLGGLNVTVNPTLARTVFLAAQGTTFMFNDAISTEIYMAENGIVYRLDSVLFDPYPITSVPNPSPTSSTNEPLSPVEIDVTTDMPVTVPILNPTGVSIPVPIPSPTIEPLSPVETSDPTFIASTSEPTASLVFCIDFVCGDGYLPRENSETRPGNDRGTCCYQEGVCDGAPVGAMCSLGDIDNSLIPNPSFEEFSGCPTEVSQLSLSTTWVQATDGTSDYFIEAPTCNDTWYKNGYFQQLGEIPQSASDGDAFVGSIKSVDGDIGEYYEYIGACLNDPLFAGVEHTFTLDVAAATDIYTIGGDTNGETDILCIPTCGLFPIPGVGYKGNDFEILATAAPDGGLIGGADWKSITFTFVPTVDCPAIMLGPSANQTIQATQEGSYVIYDFLNLQEGAAGVCNAQGECVPSQSFPTTVPIGSPTFSPNEICDEICAFDFDYACDPFDGSCEVEDDVRPCIAVIDASNLDQESVNAKWASFRTRFPRRPFCLLQPLQFDELFLPTMPDFVSDNRTTFAIVNRDQGDETLISDWFDLCGYSDLAATGIDFVSLFVEESGSMTRATVQASLDNFFTDLNDAELSYCSAFQIFENWIDPFNTNLGDAGEGGDCRRDTIAPVATTSSPVISPTRIVTSTPTRSVSPTVGE